MIDGAASGSAEPAGLGPPSDFKALLPVAIATGLSIVALGIVIPLLPFMVIANGGDNFQAAAIFSVFSAFAFLGAPIWGRLSDRVGRRPVMILAAAATIAAYFWLMTADALWELFASRAFAGFMAGWLAASQAFAADVTRPEDRAKAMGMLGAAFGVGFTIGPAIGAITVGGAGPDGGPPNFALPLSIAVGCAALTLVVAAIFIREPKKHAVDDPDAMRLSVSAILQRPRLAALFAPYFLVSLVFTAVEGTFAVWGEQTLGLGPREVGYFLAFAGICNALVQGGLVGRAVAKFGEVRTAFVGAAALSLGSAWLGFAESPGGVVVPIALVAIAMGLHNPAMQGMMSILAPTAWRGGVMGAAHSTASMARIIGPAAGGLALEHIGIASQFFIGAVMLLPALYLITRFQGVERAATAKADGETGR
ncbi:MAG: MFS transporter [Alphaproteobacteria bacterium]|nr:MFS transporter [Alphaproteobacteria bacterium]